MKYRFFLLIVLIQTITISGCSQQSNNKGLVLQLPDLIPYCSGNLWGYCDKNKKIIIPTIYEKVHFFDTTRRLAIVQKNGLKGCINSKGKEIVPIKYNTINEWHNMNNYEGEIMPPKNYIIANTSLYTNDGLLVYEFKDETGKNKLDEIHFFDNNYFIVTIKDYWGKGQSNIYNGNGVPILKNSETLVTFYFVPNKDSLIIGKKDGKCKVYNLSGENINNVSFPYLHFFNEKVYIYSDDSLHEKVGLVNLKGEILLKCEYAELTKNNKYFEIFESLDSKMGGKTYSLVDGTGKVLSDKYYNFIDQYTEKKFIKVGRYAERSKNNFELKYGVYNIEKGALGNCIYDDIRIENDGYTIAKLNRKYIIIDSIGRAYDCPANEITYLGDGDFSIKKEGKYGVINSSGQIKLECKFDMIGKVLNTWFIVKENGKFSFLDLKLKNQLNMDFEEWQSVYDEDPYDAGLVLPNYNNLKEIKDTLYVSINGKNKEIFLDKNENQVSASISNLIQCKNSYYILKNKNKQYFFRFDGSLYGPFENMENLGIPHDGLICFIDNKTRKSGFADANGKVVISAKFDPDYSWKFKNGIAKVSVNDKYGLIDKNGNYIHKPYFDKIEDLENEVYLVELNHKYGLMNKNCKIVINPEYATLVYGSDGFFFARKVNSNSTEYTSYLIGSDGKVILEEKNLEIENTNYDGLFRLIDNNNKLIGYKDINNNRYFQ